MTETKSEPAAITTPEWRAQVDRDIARLKEHATEWARLGLRRKIELLEGLRDRTAAQAERWVELAIEAKGIPAGSPLAGEEWTSGPWALLYGVNRLAETLSGIEKTAQVRLSDGAVRTRPDGQVIVDVFPQSAYDALLLSGIKAEVWMQPGVTATNLRETMGTFYSQPNPEGAVSLVLGAGNIASIAPLDVVHK